MDKVTAAELLDLIIERAPALRVAGVLRVDLGGAGFHLAPAADSSAVLADEDDAHAPVGLLRDPFTHGVPPGRDVPAAVEIKRQPI